MNDDNNNTRVFFEQCELKLDHIIQEIKTLREDMSEKYKKIGNQFKILAFTLGICLGLTVHQLFAAVVK